MLKSWRQHHKAISGEGLSITQSPLLNGEDVHGVRRHGASLHRIPQTSPPLQLNPRQQLQHLQRNSSFSRYSKLLKEFISNLPSTVYLCIIIYSKLDFP